MSLKSTTCDICGATVSQIKNIYSHKKTEKCLTVKKIFEQKYNEYINKIKQLEESNKRLEEKINILRINYELIEKENMMNKVKAEEYRKIVEKSATKTTVKNNYTHNNYLNLISQEPIRFSNITKQLKDVVTTNSLMFDDNEFHEHIVDNILRDENGKDKVLCTDINRKNFSYKDESSGELISDPELERLREQFKKGTDVNEIKIIKRDLLNKLIEKYEGTNVDPYVKFYEIIKKLDFGGQFVDHVAKKTYVKTMKIDKSIEYN
jgi:hypothetical protein